MFSFIIFSIISYLLGSLSSAIIVCKLMGFDDPRTQGSKNPGATNVMRIGGKKAAYLTFAGDFFKGLFPVLLARWLAPEASMYLAIAGAALGAFLGHLYPLYFGFKGGKGVATLVGVLIGISPVIFLIFGVIWLAIVYATGYVSLASMTAACVTTLVSLALSPLAITALLAVLSALAIYRHKENITKLRNGTENRFRKDKNHTK